jgi:hypothetical protein
MILSRKIVFALSLFCMFGAVAYGYSLLIANGRNESELSRIVDRFQPLVDEVSFLRQSIMAANAMNGTALDKLLTFNKKDMPNDSLALPTLVFRYSAGNCPTCVDENIEALKELSSEVNASRIALFVELGHERDLLFIKRRLGDLQFLVQRVSRSHADSIRSPYYFILLPDSTVQSVFFPVLRDIQLTKSYYNSVREIYFERDIRDN